MILSKNNRNEAIARAWAALVAAIVMREDAPEDEQDAANQRVFNGMARAVKALGMERKIKANQTHRLIDYVNELSLIGLLIILLDEQGVDVPPNVLQAQSEIRGMIKQFVKS